MVLPATDTHPATTALWSRCFTRKFHFLSPTLHTCPQRKSCQAEDLVPQGGQWCQDRWSWTSGCAMWIYRKLGLPWGPRYLQWHESVLAIDSLSSFPAVKWPSVKVARSSSLRRGALQTGCWPWITEQLHFMLVEADAWTRDSLLKLWAAHLRERGEPEGQHGSCQLHPLIAQIALKKEKNPIWPKTWSILSEDRKILVQWRAVGGDIWRVLTSFLGTSMRIVNVNPLQLIL